MARDVMIPCTAVLRLDDPRDRAEILFQRTQLDALPVVDDKGKLLGAVFQDAPHRKRANSVRDMPLANPPSCDEQATFASLMDCCTRELPSLIIIVHDGKPVGVVSPGQLATLSDPVTSGTFAPSALVMAGSEYLLIKDGCAQD
jgi:CBS-domain-containing membrane protein